MNVRPFLSLVVSPIVIVLPLVGQTAPHATKESARTKTKASTVARTADGHPDLQGIWTNTTITPLERSTDLAGKSVLTETEAAAYEKQILDRVNFDRRDGGPEVDVTRAYNNLFMDRGTQLSTIDGKKRTSIIVDPPDGRIPPLTPEGTKRVDAQTKSLEVYDSYRNRPLAERCVIGQASTGGPPMLPGPYNNNYQIVQTPEYLMVLVEQIHDVRIIRLDGRPHLPANIRQWMGDSLGHWEGDTLVVDTTNLTDKTGFRGSTENMHVIERFTRVDANTILYRFTIDDPSTFARQWTGEYPFLAAAGPIYEYACHEGNYAMGDILRGARLQEKAPQNPAK
jgi:hypothetical protein